MDYLLYLEVTVTKEEIFALLEEQLPQFSFRLGDWGGRSGDRLLLGGHVAVAVSERQGETEHNFVSHTNVLIVVTGAPELHEQSIRGMMSVVVTLLLHFKGGAILQEDSEKILFRQQDQLILNSTAFQNSGYLRQALDLVALPYQMQELPYWWFLTNK